MQDQKLMRRILDKQTGRTPLKIDEYNIYSQFQNNSNSKFIFLIHNTLLCFLLDSNNYNCPSSNINNMQKSSLRWNVIVNPKDNYTYNKYINHMRASEGLHNFE